MGGPVSDSEAAACAAVPVRRNRKVVRHGGAAGSGGALTEGEG